jgi:NADPH2:quinone reductase
MSRAIVLREPGPPEVLKVESVEVGAPAAGQIRLRQTYVSVNFHDCYVRSGLYKTLPLPGIPGLEGVGVVEAVGPGVTAFREGDRVAYFTGAYGGYAEARLIDANLPVRIPDDLDDRTIAASWLRGLTAQMLAYSVFPIRAGQTVLIHAAAGGVGRLLSQLAHHLGATVIGTVGSPEKAELARQAGCDHTILYRQENFVDRVREITAGRGVDVAYDSVGKDTFLGSLDVLAKRGHLCNFGQSSGTDRAVRDLAALRGFQQPLPPGAVPLLRGRGARGHVVAALPGPARSRHDDRRDARIRLRGRRAGARRPRVPPDDGGRAAEGVTGRRRSVVLARRGPAAAETTG